MGTKTECDSTSGCNGLHKMSNHLTNISHEKHNVTKFKSFATSDSVHAIIVLIIFLGLDSEFHCREGSCHSLLLLCLLCSLSLGQCPTHGPCLLGSEVLGHVLGLGGGLAETVLLLLIVNGQNAGNGFADRLDLGNFGSGAISDLGDMQFRQFLAEVSQSLDKILLGHVSQFVSLDHFEISVFLQSEKETIETSRVSPASTSNQRAQYLSNYRCNQEGVLLCRFVHHHGHHRRHTHLTQQKDDGASKQPQRD